jgi:dihydroorotate dehydrogenase electron transfer subunit
MEIKFERLNKPVVTQIIETRVETPRVRTLQFSVPGLNVVPGQFFMIWVPGIDEIPMSVSSIDNDDELYEITVAMIGEATEALGSMAEGETIGVRGPFGNGFDLNVSDERVCIVGGGVGTACINPVVNHFFKVGKEFVLLNAARTEKELVFHENYLQFFHPGKDYFISTDDGTCGEQCYAHELLEKIIDENAFSFDKIYICGPERMLYQIFLACKNHSIQLEASLERMMRCGNGLCGLCSIDPTGLLVCKDGPVFTLEQLETITEFGKYTRDFSGFKKDL